jgi:hypothetical protein
VLPPQKSNVFEGTANIVAAGVTYKGPAVLYAKGRKVLGCVATTKDHSTSSQLEEGFTSRGEKIIHLRRGRNP